MLSALLDIKTELKAIEWDFIKSVNEPLHSIHSYPAKFIPEIPRALINILPMPKDTLILDPFCGSGVTLVEAQAQNIDSVGIDLNPIACLISSVKTQILPLDFLSMAREVVTNAIKTKKNNNIPNIPNLDHWFKRDIQQALANLNYEISKVADQSTQKALKFCLSSIIVKVSNQDSDTRYAAVDKKCSQEDLFNFFLNSCDKLVKSKTKQIHGVESLVLNKSCLDITHSDFNKPVGLVITSPPYPNAYEYWLYHKYRMWWLGFDPLEVKKNEIGARAHYFKKNHQTIDDFIAQMQSLLILIANISAPNIYMCFIIGRSKIHGEIFKNDEILAEIAKKIGMTHVTTIPRKIKTDRKSFNLSHARIKEEYIVIIQK